MVSIVEEICSVPQETCDPTDSLIDWRQRYEGVLMVAYLDGKAVAGISGPWPVNQYALTWWDRPMPARQLELFDSLSAAQQRVEDWAMRLRTIGVIDRPPANDPILPEATVSIIETARVPAKSVSAAPEAPIRMLPDASIPIVSRTPASWLGRLRDAFIGTPASRRKAAPRERADALRHPPLGDDALRDIHFAAIE